MYSTFVLINGFNTFIYQIYLHIDILYSYDYITNSTYQVFIQLLYIYTTDSIKLVYGTMCYCKLYIYFY